MKESNDNRLPENRETWADALVDRGLRETLGQDQPPDLSAQILAAAGESGELTPSTVANAGDESGVNHGRRRAWRWASAVGVAAAACWVAFGIVLPNLQEPSQIARRAPDHDAANVAKPTSNAAGKSSSHRKQQTPGAATTEGSELRMAVKPDVLVDDSESLDSESLDLGSTFASDSATVEGPANSNDDGVTPAFVPTQDIAAPTSDSLGLVAQGAARGVEPTPASARPAVVVSDGAQSLHEPAVQLQQNFAVQPRGGARVDSQVWEELTERRRNRFYADDDATPGIRELATDQLATLPDAGIGTDRYGYFARGSQEAKDGRGESLYDEGDGSTTAFRVRPVVGDLAAAPEVDVLNEQGQVMQTLRGDSATEFLHRRRKGWEWRRDQTPSSGDRYARIYDNPFKPVSTANTDNRLSTLSIDVDTAAYANVRQFLMQSGQLPPADAVRIEELVNYFHYDYQPPTDETPFAANLEVAACPWAEEHRLVRIGIKGREMDRRARPQSNLVFLVDVSGSMNEPNKLPLVVEGLKMLAEELGENDRVAIVVYASSEGLVLPSTAGIDRHKIMGVLDNLRAGGSTAGGAGIKLAYKIAQENFVKGGVNRVILCTDGDFNVGIQNTDELEQLAERSAKKTDVFLTVLGFGRGNLNDEMMERISGKGNGNYFYVDGRTEAHKVLVQEMTGTLVTIAKDVKLQVEFNPTQVAGYRLIGYENRVLAAEDFNDDKKDAGEIGAGHTVTALYEVVPFGQEVNSPGVDALKYEQSADDSAESTASVDEAASDGEERLAEASDELLTLKIRYKQPDGVTSTKLEFPVTDSGGSFADASDDFQFAAAVASFGMLLRDSPYQGHSSFAAVAEIAEGASLDHDPHGRRREFVDMARRAGELSGE